MAIATGPVSETWVQELEDDRREKRYNGFTVADLMRAEADQQPDESDAAYTVRLLKVNGLNAVTWQVEVASELVALRKEHAAIHSTVVAKVKPRENWLMFFLGAFAMALVDIAGLWIALGGPKAL